MNLNSLEHSQTAFDSRKWNLNSIIWFLPCLRYVKYNCVCLFWSWEKTSWREKLANMAGYTNFRIECNKKRNITRHDVIYRGRHVMDISIIKKGKQKNAQFILNWNLFLKYWNIKYWNLCLNGKFEFQYHLIWFIQISNWQKKASSLYFFCDLNMARYLTYFFSCSKE